MSNLVRRIQRTVKRAADPTCRAPNYMGRGSKLGVSTKQPKHKGPSRGSRRGTHKRPWRSGEES